MPEIKRRPRANPSKEAFRDEIFELRKVGDRLFELADLITACGITGTSHDRAALAALREKWDAIPRAGRSI